MADKQIFANVGPTKPSVPKSVFDLSHANNGTYRFGRAYPILCYDAPAGSSFRIKTYSGFDMHPLAFPIQTNVRCHQSFYKIPKRILWKHYKEFVGQHASDGSVASADNQYTIPYISRPIGWHKTGSLADYFGIPSESLSTSSINSTCKLSRIRSPHSAESIYAVGSPNVQGGYCSDIYIDIHNYPVFNTGHGNGYLLNFSSKNYQLRNVAYIYDIVNFHGNTLTLSFFSPVLNMSISDIVNTSTANDFSTAKVLMLVLGTQNRNSNGTSELYFPKHVRNDVDLPTGYCMRVLPSNATLRSGSSYGGVTRYYLDITLDSDMVSVLTSQSDVYRCFALHYSDSCPLGSVLAENSASDYNFTYGDKDDSTIIQTMSELSTPHLFDTAYYSQSVVAAVDSQYLLCSVPGVNDGKPYLPVSALPFRAYQFIYNYFFRNERVTPFMKNGQNVFNEFLTNDGDGADYTTPVDFWHVPFEYDLFTTCVNTPQFGNAPLVGITTNDSTATFLMQDVSVTDSEDVTSQYSIQTDVHNGKIVNISNYSDVADKPSVHRLQEAINFGISINDFRNVNALQRFQERYLKAGTKYQNIVYEFFGTNPPIGEEFPEYIGGCTTSINVSKVVSTADTGDKGLGGYVGNGSFAGKGKSIRCFCAEESYIIGIMYFSVTPTYSQMLPRLWTKSKLLDFYNPQFANIGLQPVYRHQLAPLQLTHEEIGEVFGYNRPFADYVSMQDEVHGEFRTSMANYLLQRIFGNKPELGSDFLYINSDDFTKVFMDMEDNDKIFGQIYFDIRAKLPIPRFAVPRII